MSKAYDPWYTKAEMIELNPVWVFIRWAPWYIHDSIKNKDRHEVVSMSGRSYKIHRARLMTKRPTEYMISEIQLIKVKPGCNIKPTDNWRKPKTH